MPALPAVFCSSLQLLCRARAFPWVRAGIPVLIPLPQLYSRAAGTGVSLHFPPILLLVELRVRLWVKHFRKCCRSLKNSIPPFSLGSPVCTQVFQLSPKMLDLLPFLFPSAWASWGTCVPGSQGAAFAVSLKPFRVKPKNFSALILDEDGSPDDSLIHILPHKAASIFLLPIASCPLSPSPLSVCMPHFPCS